MGDGVEEFRLQRTEFSHNNLQRRYLKGGAGIINEMTHSASENPKTGSVGLKRRKIANSPSTPQRRSNIQTLSCACTAPRSCSTARRRPSTVNQFVPKGDPHFTIGTLDSRPRYQRLSFPMKVRQRRYSVVGGADVRARPTAAR